MFFAKSVNSPVTECISISLIPKFNELISLTIISFLSSIVKSGFLFKLSATPIINLSTIFKIFE